MREKHGHSRGQTVALLELPRRDMQKPPAVPAFGWGLQDLSTRPRLPLPLMPNGDPPTLVLWGAEDV